MHLDRLEVNTMGVSLEKVQQQAPHLVSLVKETSVILEKKGLNPESYKAAVVGTLDFSGSASGLYQNGTMQRAADLGFAAGLVFDDDGSVPFSLFDSGVTDIGEITLGNCQGFVDKAIRGRRMGSTDYVSALKWIVDTAGFGKVNLGSGGGGFFRKGSSLEVKAKAQYPTYALFVTDGEPNGGTEGQIRQYLTQMSQLPIFVQFVGVGPHQFQFLRQLDELDGRLIDNAGFFDAKEVGNDQSKMLEAMLSEFPQYYADARRQGLVG